SPEPRPPVSPWIIITLITIVLVLVMLIAAGTLYLAYEHPAIATPIAVSVGAVGGIGAIVSAAAAIAAITRR
ncbi:hypothetical protein, partial [Streptomyces sp. I8-5]